MSLLLGAVPFYNTYSIEEFSSQGPAENETIKPDFVAPDAVSTWSYSDRFYGTSAAAPHVAGIVGLVLQYNPWFIRITVKSYLEYHAIDRGIPGKDNVYGSGLVNLPIIDPNTIDNDGDGFTENQGDCNDANNNINP